MRSGCDLLPTNFTENFRNYPLAGTWPHRSGVTGTLRELRLEGVIRSTHKNYSPGRRVLRTGKGMLRTVRFEGHPHCVSFSPPLVADAQVLHNGSEAEVRRTTAKTFPVVLLWL